MKFPYAEYVSQLPGSPDFQMIYRPMVPLRIVGPKGERCCDALVDSGADETLIPLSAAKYLGVQFHEGTSEAAGIAGDNLTIRYSEVDLHIDGDGESISWRTTIGFIEFGSTDQEVAILGHGGCLDYFTAIFNGEHAELELIPNSYLPIQ